MKLAIGVDDTDSRKGMCTTYVAALLAERLRRLGEVYELRLVRLNPNIPWKTRGNGAVAILAEVEDVDAALELAVRTVEELAETGEEGTDPGIVACEASRSERLRRFYDRALHGVVSLEEAERIAELERCWTHRLKTGRGVIGALAAIGAELSAHTYELIAYRRRENWSKPRQVESASVVEMDRATKHDTFNNLDPETGRVLITPRSPCPVLYGIRAWRREVLERAMRMVRAGEAIERYAVFKTNQGTDAHLMEKDMAAVEPFTSVIVKGRVAAEPRTIRGGHVIFTIEDGEAALDCAAYEPTGSFRGVVRMLRKGDVVRAFGGVRERRRLTINLEKLEILELAEQWVHANPLCPCCGRSMESAGKDKGYRCRSCGERADSKIRRRVERSLAKGLYCVPPRAMRHLTRPCAA